MTLKAEEEGGRDRVSLARCVNTLHAYHCSARANIFLKAEAMRRRATRLIGILEVDDC